MSYHMYTYVGPYLLTLGSEGCHNDAAEQICDEFDESLVSHEVGNGAHAWLDNGFGIGREFSRDDEPSYHSIGGGTAGEEMRAFVAKFEKEIAAIRTHTSQVAVFWGVVHYGM